MPICLRKSHTDFSRKKSHFPLGGWLSFVLPLMVFLFSFVACSSLKNFSNVDSSVSQGDFMHAYNQLELQKDSLYGYTDQVLYALDAGMLSRYYGDFEQSNKNLSDAEALIAKYFAISITQTIGSYVINDNVTDYAGEDFEDIYTNLFMALNYIQLGDTESAFVEIRRFNNKLQLLSTKYSAALEQARKQTSLEGYNAESPFLTDPNLDTLQFYDSAFARYVSLLLYRSTGRMDSANIDKKFIETAFATQAQLYPFPIPRAVQEEFSIPSNKERLNVFCYTGSAPEKKEEIVRLPNVVDNTWFKLALPVMQKNPSKVSSIHIQAINEMGYSQESTLQLIESVENIAIDTFQQKQGLIYLKTLLRSISKSAVNEGVTSVMQESQAAQWAPIFNLAANIFTEFSEQADVRSSRYFPAQIWVGGLNVDEGLYDVKVTCYDAFNTIIYQQINENIVVKENNVNLVEAVCLK